MQRQSLGSPVSKLNIHGGELLIEDLKRKDLPSSSSSSSPLTHYEIDEEEEHHKSVKPRRSSVSISSPNLPLVPEKLIHIIPFLTVFCFLVLYLFSHTPSQSDLVQFNGFQRSSKHHIDSSEIDDISGFIEIGGRSDVLPIRSLRNLQEINKPSTRYRLHRKIGGF